MAVASVVGLLAPAVEEGSLAAVAAGLVAGVAFLSITRAALGHRDLHVGVLHGAGVRRSALVFAVLLVHSLPEGFAIGTAYASDREGLGLFVILAIALQNVATSAPQPVGAIAAYLLVEEIAGLLPVSFAFAAGAMLSLVATELVPQAFTRTSWRSAGSGAAAGTALMLALSAVLGV
jgi:ZIP family zinc transporter